MQFYRFHAVHPSTRKFPNRTKTKCGNPPAYYEKIPPSRYWNTYRRLAGTCKTAHCLCSSCRGTRPSHFVDPRTGVHTQEVESYWSQPKLGQKRKKGIRREVLQSYIDERMWRQRRGGSHRCFMRYFLAIVPHVFLPITQCSDKL